MPDTAVTADRRAELDDLTTRFVGAFNRQDLDAIMSYFGEGVVYEDPYGERHDTMADIRAQFDRVVGGKLGKIAFEAEDRFIDPVAGKVMDSWVLRMWIGDKEKEERTMRGLDLLHWEGDKLVRKITYKQD
jgi:ketosteroid isomerase-like protein